jgi:hypothetical protein
MATLLNLTPKKRKELFMSKMKDFALEEKKDKRPYVLGCIDGNYFCNLNLKDLIFIANNEYELWLIINEYLSKNLNYNKKKHLISLREITKNDILLQSKYQRDIEEDDIFKFYDDEEIIETIQFLMEDDNDDTIKIKDVIDEVIDDLFKNDFFWVREVINADYVTDSEDESSEDD